MHADMEIQSAAKLPSRHLRRSGGTGARSLLQRRLSESKPTSCIRAIVSGHARKWDGFVSRSGQRRWSDLSPQNPDDGLKTRPTLLNTTSPLSLIHISEPTRLLSI